MADNLLVTQRERHVAAHARIGSWWRAVLAAATLTGFCVPASAAPVLYNWTGFFLGGGGNINAATATWGFNWTRFPSPSANVGTSGGSLDFVAGYDVEVLHSAWGTTVIGVAADYAVGSSSGRTDCLNCFFDCKTTTSNVFTVRGRVGIAPNNWPVMLYATGGGANATFVDQKISSFAMMRMGPLDQGVTTQRWGSVEGVGVQYMLFRPQTLPAFNGSLSVNTELCFTQFCGFNPAPRVSINENVVEWQFGLTYKFVGSPIPF